MPLSKAAVGLALVAAGTAACLGNSLAQRGLLKPSWAAPAAGETWALARYEGWLSVLFAQCAAWLAVAGITRWVLWVGRAALAQLALQCNTAAGLPLCGCCLARPAQPATLPSMPTL